MIRSRLQHWLVLGAAACSAGSSVFAEDKLSESNMLDAPEIEIAKVLNDLELLSDQITGTYQVQTRPGLAPHKLAAENAFKRAKSYFKNKEYLSAIAEVNNFRNLKQVPTTDEHLEAAYIQALSYDAMQLSRQAIQSYMHYISAAVTSPKRNYSEVLDALRRLIPLASKEAMNGTADIGPLLSSVTSIEFPEEKRAELTYLAARTAGQTTRTDVASTWYKQSSAETKDVNLKARSLYFQALLAIGKKDFVTADQYLQEALKLEGAGADEFKGFARLALARIAMHQRKPERALAYYNDISETATNFKDATFESTYVLLQTGDRPGAIARARLFLKLYPNDRQALQIKNLLGYLELNAGDLVAARKQIEDADQQYADFHSWVLEAFSGKTPITQTTIDEAVKRGEILQQPPALVTEAQKQFRRIAEQTRHLADTRGDLQQTVFTIGRTNLEQLVPSLHQRGKQLDAFVDKVLTLGHRLAATERYMYEKKLHPLKLAELKISETERTKLLSAAADTRRRRYQWAQWFNLNEINTDLAKKNADLADAAADMAAIRYLTARNPEAPSNVEELRVHHQQTHEKLTKSLLAARGARVRAIDAQTRHQLTRALLAQYASALHDEAQILGEVRDDETNAGKRFLSEDADKAWSRWERTTEQLFRQFDLLDSDIKKHTFGLLADVDARLERADTLMAKLNDARVNLEATLLQAAPLLLSQYEQDIEQQRSRHLKWQADIDRLRSDEAKNNRTVGNDKFQLEQQMMQYNMQAAPLGNLGL